MKDKYCDLTIGRRLEKGGMDILMAVTYIRKSEVRTFVMKGRNGLQSIPVHGAQFHSRYRYRLGMRPERWKH